MTPQLYPLLACAACQSTGSKFLHCTHIEQISVTQNVHVFVELAATSGVRTNLSAHHHLRVREHETPASAQHAHKHIHTLHTRRERAATIRQSRAGYNNYDYTALTSAEHNGWQVT